MRVAPDLVAGENRLWAAADQLWANTGLRPADFSESVIGLMFLRYADKREYNAGSRNMEALFAELMKFARELSDEERRGVAEGLTEEELALFDILTKPEPVLTKADQADVKKVCRDFLETLKREKLVLDWREKQQARASVMQTLKLEMKRLPGAFTREIRDEKLARAYAHVCDHYFGSDSSVYSAAGLQ